MRERWAELCVRIGPGAGAGVGARLFDELERLYATPVRAYHSMAHVADCLEVFDGAGAAADDRDGVEWALWLHDCVYDATRSDNEARSAEVSSRMLEELGAGRAKVERAGTLIMATRHTGAALEGDAALVADVDMSILGREPAVYGRYAAAVREEYAFVPDEAFRAGRGAFLDGLLARAAIYHLATFRERFEAAARRNIAHERAGLRASGPQA